MKTKSKITMGKEREILSKQEAIGSEKKKVACDPCLLVFLIEFNDVKFLL